MKKFLFPALALGLVMTSCQSDEPFAPGMGEEVEATFTISVPDAMGTRAGEVNSALGGFSNGAGNLNYTVALLRAEDGVVMWSSKTPASVNGKSATFNPTVVQGYTYKIVAYATFDSAIEAPTVGSKIPADSGLGAIATLEGINNESEDAYFCNTTILGASSMEATLKRPFGKLRLVAEDYDKFHALGLVVANVKVTYGGAVVMNTQFDASKKAFEGTATSKVFEFAGETSYSEEANKDTNGVYTVFTDYLPASETGETMYPFEIEVTYKNGKGTYTRTFSQDIPVKRNYLTTLRGNFFTTEAALTLTVDEMFEGNTELDIQYAYYYPTTKDDLKDALSKNDEHIYITLTDDLSVDVTAWETIAFGGEDTKSITIDGAPTRSENHTLTFNQLDSDWNNITTKNNAKLILKNLKVTNSGYNDGPWNRHDLNFACDVEMEKVVSDKAIALKAGGVLKNVTIDDANGSDTYALWIQPKGQVVTLENCVIDMLDCTDGRGIKIDEQYLDEVKAPTLNVSGTIFKTEEKAAVIVKSKDGAVINWGEGNNISAVAADNVNAVWVDEASGAYANKVIVNGAYKIVEGKYEVVSTQEDLNNLAKKENQTIQLPAGTFELNDIAAGVTLRGVGVETVVDVQNKTYGVYGDVTIEDIKLVYSNANYKGFQHTGIENYKNCTIEGQPFLYGNNVTFDNCTFVQTSSDAYNVWTYGAKNVTFNKCVFNSAGKSVLIYNEGGNGQNATFDNCKFNASVSVEGKAAIEIDSSLLSGDYKYNVTINNCTDTGFAQGSVSGNSLWNVKKDKNPSKTTVKVNNSGVYPQVAAKIGAIEYKTVQAAIAGAKAGDVINIMPGTYEGEFDLTHKNLTIEGDAILKGMVWVDDCTVEFRGLTLTNPNGVQHANPTNSQYYTTINNQYPLVGAYNNANVTFQNCTFDIVGSTVYGFYGYAHNNPKFYNCTFNCNGIRPIASNGASIVVDRCTFVDQYHYSVRIFENAGEKQTVVYTNNIVKGTNTKGEFEGVNISKKAGTATIHANFTIKGNTSGLKYRHHKNVTMGSDCTYDTDITNFAFEKEN